MALKVAKPKAQLPIYTAPAKPMRESVQEPLFRLPDTRTVTPQSPKYMNNIQAPLRTIQGTQFDQTDPQIGVIYHMLNALANPPKPQMQQLVGGWFGGPSAPKTVPKLPKPRAQAVAKLPLVGR